jgi:hypothetical protein
MPEEQTAVEQPNPPLAGTGSVGKGVLIGLAIALGVGIMGIPLVIPPLGIGLIQLIWVIPMVRSYRKKGETETAKGMVIQAAIIGFLNAACWGVVIVGLSNANFH